MIDTTDHAVRKMSNLVDHMRRPASDNGDDQQLLDLTSLVISLLEHYSQSRPTPRLEGNPPQALVLADEEQLRSVLGHLIQNAQDATPPDGEITVSLKIARGNVALFIHDSGCGMTGEFINCQLFKPFESTKV